jgi:hypothetical protein
MKVTLEFDLPEEKQEAELAMNVGELYSTLNQVNHILRYCLKHDGDPRDAVIECRSLVSDVLGRFE